MYNPTRFKSENWEEAFQLMDRYPFATLITASKDQPEVSLLPLTPKKTEDGLVLIGHMARANPHWKSFQNAAATVLFQGPHTYITPEWYVKNDVPTWSYLAVQAIGSIELVHDSDSLIKCLKELSAHVERHWPSGWEFFIPDDLSGANLQRGLVGFHIKVESILFKKKLNQGRSLEDHAGVIEGLAARGDDQSREIRNEMLKLSR